MKYFTTTDQLCSCCDIKGLMSHLSILYKADDWWLFIHSSKMSLKPVLLHNPNKNPSIPVAHAVGMKATYESMSFILKAVNYDAHLWRICGDLKVICLLLGKYKIPLQNTTTARWLYKIPLLLMFVGQSCNK